MIVLALCVFSCQHEYFLFPRRLSIFGQWLGLDRLVMAGESSGW